MTSIVRSIAIALVAAALARGVAAAKSLDESLTASVPGIYTLQVPHGDVHKECVVALAAQLDLLGAAPGADGAHLALRFLVASKTDLHELEALAPADFALAFDRRATEELRRHEPSRDALAAHAKSTAAAETIPGFPCYRNVAGTFRLLDELVERAATRANLEVTRLDIGDSYEKSVDPGAGHDILALKVTGHGAAARGWTTTKGLVYVTCGLHAREYASPELCARWAETLVDGYGADARITSLLDHADVYLVLQANPDGMTVAVDHPELYRRKNTRPGCSNADRRGVDLNRNFPFLWGRDSGSAVSRCAIQYRGAGPASEPETQALVAHLRAVFPAAQRKADPEGQMDEAYPEDNVGVYIDVHSYGEVILYPWSYANEKSPNDEGLQAAARKIAQFNGYAPAGPGTTDIMYSASGVTAEFAYGELGACGFGYELGTAWYQDCAAFESTIAPDNLPSLTYLASISSKPFALSKGPDIMHIDISVEGALSSQTVTFTVKASDKDLSAGSDDGFPTTTQAITSVALTFDMHPDDKEDGVAPVVLQLAVPPNTGTAELTASYAVADLAPLFVGPAAGPHVAHVWAVDSAGYAGPVFAKAFAVLSTLGSGRCAVPVTTHQQCKAAPPLLGMAWGKTLADDAKPGGCFAVGDKGKVFFNREGDKGTGCTRTKQCLCEQPYGLEEQRCAKPLSQSACEAAAEALGWGWRRNPLVVNDKPRGCFVDNIKTRGGIIKHGRVNFNEYGTEGTRCEEGRPCVCHA